MTTEEKHEANVLVAEAMGWDTQSVRTFDGEGGYDVFWVAPGELHGLDEHPPDLFAKTPDGAKAREDARHWILAQAGQEWGLEVYTSADLTYWYRFTRPTNQAGIRAWNCTAKSQNPWEAEAQAIYLVVKIITGA